MPRLYSAEYGPPSHLGPYWKEVLTGTFVWSRPTPEEEAAARARRRDLLEASQVPAIVSDAGALLTFFDDVFDVLNFTRWNAKLLSLRGIKNCVAARSGPGYIRLGELMRCLCPGGTKGKRHLLNAYKPFAPSVSGDMLAAAAALKLVGGPIGWMLLAGQVSMILFGVGISLGPIVGAIGETIAAGAAAIGFPFGADGNKQNQLQRWRTIRRAREGLGAMQYLPLGDQLAAINGVRYALRDVQPSDPIVVPPSEYPHLIDIVTDPFGTVRSLGRLAASLMVNGLSHIVPGLADDMTADLGRLTAAGIQPVATPPDAALKAALKVIHDRRCPRKNTCKEVTDEMVRFQEFFADHGLSDTYHRPQAQSLWELFFGEAAVPVG